MSKSPAAPAATATLVTEPASRPAIGTFPRLRGDLIRCTNARRDRGDLSPIRPILMLSGVVEAWLRIALHPVPDHFIGLSVARDSRPAALARKSLVPPAAASSAVCGEIHCDPVTPGKAQRRPRINALKCCENWRIIGNDQVTTKRSSFIDHCMSHLDSHQSSRQVIIKITSKKSNFVPCFSVMKRCYLLEC